VYSLRRGAAEAIEAVVRGDRRTSRVVGRSLDELDLPEATTIGGIVRGDKLLIAHHDIIIEPGDHLILVRDGQAADAAGGRAAAGRQQLSMLPPRMQAMQRVFGAIVALSSLITVPPLLLAWWLGEGTQRAFLDSLLVIATVGLVLWYPVRSAEYELRLRDGFLITAALWIIASLVTALPFMLAAPHLRFVDAVFESTPA
jgi:hypothetical protein